MKRRWKEQRCNGSTLSIQSNNGHPTTDKAAPQSPEAKAALHEHLLIEFGLTVLQGALRSPRGVLSGRDPATLALVDPLLPLLVRALAGERRLGCVSLLTG